jgi:hypothetical protein
MLWRNRTSPPGRQADQTPHQRALARSVLPHNAHEFALLQLEIHILQGENRRRALVFKGQIPRLENHRRSGVRSNPGRLGVRHHGQPPILHLLTDLFRHRLEAQIHPVREGGSAAPAEGDQPGLGLDQRRRLDARPLECGRDARKPLPLPCSTALALPNTST